MCQIDNMEYRKTHLINEHGDCQVVEKCGRSIRVTIIELRYDR